MSSFMRAGPAVAAAAAAEAELVCAAVGHADVLAPPARRREIFYASAADNFGGDGGSGGSVRMLPLFLAFKFSSSTPCLLHPNPGLSSLFRF